ncbi:hypothetical protein GCM10007888_26480 [Methylobacterium oxalidis]|nr:hypothetical protein LDDCCGHA_0918 [Methylobacterium oxalidis]GLS64267.1 hypothetical protein GCM10007888_26480 [Methylobacterium oxalidis]
MNIRLLLTPSLLVSLHAPLPAIAQSAAEPGTGGGPASTIRAPNTAATGQTVPRPGALNPEETDGIQRRTRQQQEDDAITKGICIGCSPR